MANDARPKARNGTAEAAKDAILLVDLAIRRTRGNAFVGEQIKEFICKPLEEAKQEILLIEDQNDRVGMGLVHGEKEVAGIHVGADASLSAPSKRIGEES